MLGTAAPLPASDAERAKQVELVGIPDEHASVGCNGVYARVGQNHGRPSFQHANGLRLYWWDMRDGAELKALELESDRERGTLESGPRSPPCRTSRRTISASSWPACRWTPRRSSQAQHRGGAMVMRPIEGPRAGRRAARQGRDGW